MSKPYAPACDRNREAIYELISKLFKDCKSVLEIGSGTGQHGVYFAELMPQLSWQCSDLAQNQAGIEAWLQDAGLNNTPSPLVLDVNQQHWPNLAVDAVFSANAIHIMGWESVKAMIKGVGQLLDDGALLVLYGPFNYNGAFSSESNARFDVWLKQQDPQSGIRDFEEVDRLARQAGLDFCDDLEMPANNRIIYWKKNNTAR